MANIHFYDNLEPTQLGDDPSMVEIERIYVRIEANCWPVGPIATSKHK